MLASYEPVSARALSLHLLHAAPEVYGLTFDVVNQTSTLTYPGAYHFYHALMARRVQRRREKRTSGQQVG